MVAYLSADYMLSDNNINNIPWETRKNNFFMLRPDFLDCHFNGYLKG